MTRGSPLSAADRWVLAVAIVLLDAVLFAVPLTGLLAAVILLTRPRWFRDWVDRLYRS